MLSLRFPDLSARWLAAGVSAVLWALAAGSLALWWLHLPRQVEPSAVVAGQASAEPLKSNRADVERALGRAAAQVAAVPDGQKRFALLGVIATDAGQGSALLAVDGQPARAFVRGQTVADGWRLDAVHSQGVRLAADQAGGRLDLPLPSVAARPAQAP